MKHALRKLAIPTLVLTTALTLTACGGSEPTDPSNGGMNHGSSANGMNGMSHSASPSSSATGTPAAGEHNGADVDFATGMVPHHRQAVQMAQMASGRAASAKVTALAARIRAAQDPEIAQMSGWLIGWGAEVPADNGMGSMHHSGGTEGTDGAGSMGMMSTRDMEMLQQMTGKSFDIAFLKGMIAHHRGAVVAAKVELTDGSNAEAKKLAQAIIAGQTREIAEMDQLLTER